MDGVYARMPKWVIGIEDWQWYDGIAYYLDEATGQRYSRNGYPIANDEMCKPTMGWWIVCKVEQIIDWEWALDYHWKVLSSRPDTDGETNITA